MAFPPLSLHSAFPISSSSGREDEKTSCYLCLLHGIYEGVNIEKLLSRLRLMAIYEEQFNELEKVYINDKNKYIRFKKNLNKDQNQRNIVDKGLSLNLQDFNENVKEENTCRWY